MADYGILLLSRFMSALRDISAWRSVGKCSMNGHEAHSVTIRCRDSGRDS